MNKIVREHYPVSQLPADIRAEFPEDVSVKITVEEQGGGLTKEQALERIARLQDDNRGRGVSLEDAVGRIRRLRDEWDD
jgi:hypothetical protein